VPFPWLKFSASSPPPYFLPMSQLDFWAMAFGLEQTDEFFYENFVFFFVCRTGRMQLSPTCNTSARTLLRFMLTFPFSAARLGSPWTTYWCIFPPPIDAFLSVSLFLSFGPSSQRLPPLLLRRHYRKYLGLPSITRDPPSCYNPTQRRSRDFPFFFPSPLRTFTLISLPVLPIPYFLLLERRDDQVNPFRRFAMRVNLFFVSAIRRRPLRRRHPPFVGFRLSSSVELDIANSWSPR